MIGVSVVIPTYNRPDKVVHAVGSVLSSGKNTTFDIEIILVNDSSDVDYSPVIEFFSNKIRYFLIIKTVDLPTQGISVFATQSQTGLFSLMMTIELGRDISVNYRSQLKITHPPKFFYWCAGS